MDKFFLPCTLWNRAGDYARKRILQWGVADVRVGFFSTESADSRWAPTATSLPWHLTCRPIFSS